MVKKAIVLQNDQFKTFPYLIKRNVLDFSTYMHMASADDKSERETNKMNVLDII